MFDRSGPLQHRVHFGLWGRCCYLPYSGCCYLPYSGCCYLPCSGCCYLPCSGCCYLPCSGCSVVVLNFASVPSSRGSAGVLCWDSAAVPHRLSQTRALASKPGAAYGRTYELRLEGASHRASPLAEPSHAASLAQLSHHAAISLSSGLGPKRSALPGLRSCEPSRSPGTGPTLTLRVLSLNFASRGGCHGTLFAAVVTRRSYIYTCLTQMQHSLRCGIIYSSNEGAANTHT